MPKYEFDHKAHIGTVDGVEYPSVTQLLQEFGLIDFTNVPAETLEYKKVLGLRVHKAIELLDLCRLDEDHFKEKFPECVPYLEAYKKFRLIEPFDPEYKENRYFSNKWRFHGAPDESGIHLSNLGDVPTLIDYKCVWRMYPATGAQLRAYGMLIEENLGIKIKQFMGLQLKPNGNYEKVFYRDKSDLQDFQMCLALHWKKREKYKTAKGVVNR